MELQEKYFYTAEEVSALLGVKKSRAYDIIKKLNSQLEEQGMLTVRGRVSVKYLHKKMLNVDAIN